MRAALTWRMSFDIVPAGHPTRVGTMKLYRINKVAKPGGVVVKKTDVLAASDRDAVKRAAESDDCPVCEVLKEGQQVGVIV